MKNKPLVISLVVVACTDAAKAKIMAKKNKAAAARAPMIVMVFTDRLLYKLGFKFAFQLQSVANGLLNIMGRLLFSGLQKCREVLLID